MSLRVRVAGAWVVTAVVVAAILAGGGPGGATCNLSATTANFSTQFTAASGGQTVCLAAGSYAVPLTADKTPAVTLKPQDGVGLGSVSVAISGGNNGSSNPRGVTLDGVTVTGVDVGSTSGGGTYNNLTIRNSNVTGQVVIRGCGATQTNLLFDNNEHVNFSVSSGSVPEARVHFHGSQPGTCNADIRNSLFDGGCSDGIQTGADGVEVGPGNEFRNIVHSGCPFGHIDAYQCWCEQPLVFGNFFHDNSFNIMINEGGADDAHIYDNVIYANGEDSRAVSISGTNNAVVEHNTLRGTLMNKTSTGANPSQAAIGSIIRNNIITGGIARSSGDPSVPAVVDYNLLTSSCSFCPAGTGNISGSATFTGGANPLTMAGHQLTTGSLGYQDASDGLDIGARF